MKSVCLSFLVISSLLAMLACGGSNNSSSSSSSTAVSISPTSASVASNATQQFTATVSNSSSGVSWSVNSIAGGNLTVGTISTTGLYTAPAVIPSPSSVTVTATSQADSSQTASAKITITQGTSLSLTISPGSASVFTSQSQQFSAVVTPNTNTAVTWEVNSVIGGNSTVGTITTAGLYTAPATVPSPANVTLTAVSQADTSKTATASVTVVLGTVLAITPATVVLPGGGQQAFSATANSQPATVTWSLNCQSTAAGACGSITAAGVYTAPPTPPPSGRVTLTATTPDGSALPTSAAITIQFSNGSLNGSYAFSFAGHSAGTPFAAAGSVAFDGSGTITGGTEDISGAAVASVNITGGSYHIGTDGRGNAVVQTAGGSETWQLVVVNNSRAFAARFDGGTITGSGTLDLQQTSQFALSALQGPYTLRLSGATPESVTLAGAFSADGAGGLSNGLLDVSGGGKLATAQALSGAYTAPSSSGRGALTLTSSNGTQNFAYYIADNTHIVLVETDAGQALRGELIRQPAGPFGFTSFNGSYAFALSGSAAQGPLGVGGTFALDGAGNVSSGAEDRNLNGNWQTGLPLTGTYQVTDTATGRTTAALNVNGTPVQYAFYPEIGGGLNFIQVDGGSVAAGLAFAQASTAFGTASLQGTYALRLAGTDFTTSAGEEDVVGTLSPNGGSAIAGSVDISDNGILTRGSSVQGSYITAPTTGRAAATLQAGASALQNAAVNIYVIDAGNALLLETDSNRVLVGSMQKQ